ncbi:hypothetical protein [Gordonia namibiensis]|uniref:hypothetical protein n=1 Tax=Gordonia namibiensis TaxID=168480 RepID=UPI00030F5F53|nr:hypothetical protein [Gordonia namibiensis]
MLKAVEQFDAFLADVESDDPGIAAGLGAVRALIKGTDPRWAAVRAFVSAMSVKAKVILILAVILGLLLAPVLLVVVLLGGLVLAIVMTMRGAGG